MRKLRQSQVINNFFTLASIIIISVVLTLYIKYIKDEESKPITKEKVIPLICEKESFTQYKVFNQELLNESQKALNRGYYKISSSYKKSKKIKSIVEDYISLNELDSFYIKAIGKKNKENIQKYLTIDYKIIEKDKDTKTAKIKRKTFYSGSILTTFKADDKDIFKVFTDFRMYDKNEIKSRIDCSIKVYRNHVKKL